MAGLEKLLGLRGIKDLAGENGVTADVLNAHEIVKEYRSDSPHG